VAEKYVYKPTSGMMTVDPMEDAGDRLLPLDPDLGIAKEDGRWLFILEGIVILSGGGASYAVSPLPASDSDECCQLILTSSVKRLRIVNKLDTVPPLPTSLSSWYPFISSSSHCAESGADGRPV